MREIITLCLDDVTDDEAPFMLYLDRPFRGSSWWRRLLVRVGFRRFMWRKMRLRAPICSDRFVD